MSNTPSEPIPCPQPPQSTEPEPPPRSIVLEPATHLERLRQRPQAAALPGPRPRDPVWQRAQRQRDEQVRAGAAAFWQQLRDEGLSASAAAAVLGVPARTLRQCQADEAHQSAVAFLGRPHVHGPAEEADAVIAFLNGHGPYVGLPTLRAEFPDLTRAELQDLLGCYRHLWLTGHPRELCELHWHVPGAVWAMDFTEVRAWSDGRCRYVFAVGDLASGLQLAWRPVLAPSVTAVLPELRLLFKVQGSPLVLKSDNGSAFRAGCLKRFLGRWQVWQLYSLPGAPWYNGAIEARIGSLKTRTQYQAWRHGHAEGWTSADLEQARALANTTARPPGPRGPTPAEAWAARRPATQSERDCFAATVHQCEQEAPRQEGIDLDVALDHYQQAALHRRVLQEALVQHGYLSLTRRRVPQRLFGRKVAMISSTVTVLLNPWDFKASEDSRHFGRIRPFSGQNPYLSRINRHSRIR
ncbi:MAG TPA: DDE-type integrase/transposase/recombinase [Gemmataceae bacterium]|jgi:transposase InsO family protein|nr:DDE-type integrase/transposase/recombinase [Gemmataceae bacterium]